MGVVTTAPGCERFRGLLAEVVLRGPEATADPGLPAHLVGCAMCRTERDELARAAGALAWVDPGVAAELGRSGRPVPADGPTPALDAAVAGILAIAPGRGPSRGPRPRRRTRVLVSVLAAAALVVAVAVGLSWGPAPTTRIVVLSGPGGAHATAVLTAEAWGTSVALTQPAARWGQVLTVSMSADHGYPWGAGSYWAGTSHGVTVTLACALPVDRIRTITVTDAGGRVVLSGA